MIELRSYRANDAAGLAAVWSECFSGQPNFVDIAEVDLRRRVFEQPAFDSAGIVVAAAGDEIAGFVHFGPRLDLSDDVGTMETRKGEGHIYAVAAPDFEHALTADLIDLAQTRLLKNGARRILLGPSWRFGAQPYYSCIAGAYELPGFSPQREGLMEAAADLGFLPAAEYGTPELDLTERNSLSRLAEMADALWRRVGGMLRQRIDRLDVPYFPPRLAVALVSGRKVVAHTAYGRWTEYERQYNRRLYGITGVHVARPWRGRGLGKLVLIEALLSATKDGAEAAHLHVWRGNKPAWNLYHEALRFEPKHTWITLAKTID